MARISSKLKTTIEKSILKTLPWTSSSFGKLAEIDGFNIGSGKWETIAIVNTVGGIDAEDLASFIAQQVNRPEIKVGTYKVMPSKPY